MYDGATILEDQEHILLLCDYARMAWDWVSSFLYLDLSFITLVRELLRWCTRRNLRDQYNLVLHSLIFNTL